MARDKTIIIGNCEFSAKRLCESMELACAWVTDIAQVKDENDPTPRKHKHKLWQGALRGEYRAATKAWSFFCPVWHTGQAVKALAMAYSVTDDVKLLAAAKAGADFIVNNQIKDGSDENNGLILAYEDYPDKVNTSAILECMDGLLVLDDVLGARQYSGAFMAAANWIARKAWIKGQGIFRDLYDPERKKFIANAYGVPGRPLFDDAIFIKAHKMSSESVFKDIFFETADRLLKDEWPAGNWVKYGPCNKTKGLIHPRHAYWWGFPMREAYLASNDKKYLECFERACRWYARAQRADGGLFRGTYLDFNTDSFGHAVSGLDCAMIMWLEYECLTGKKEFSGHLARGLEYCLKMQFINPSDPNLTGAILEKVLPPDGTDNSPYHIRDLGTIFFIQMAAKMIAMTNLNSGPPPKQRFKRSEGENTVSP